jgi:hypothetical protein
MEYHKNKTTTYARCVFHDQVKSLLHLYTWRTRAAPAIEPDAQSVQVQAQLGLGVRFLFHWLQCARTQQWINVSA